MEIGDTLVASLQLLTLHGRMLCHKLGQLVDEIASDMCVSIGQFEVRGHHLMDLIGGQTQLLLLLVT